jgi:hypothetical protein
MNSLISTIENAETRQHERALAIAMRDKNLPEEEVQAEAELQGIDYNHVVLERSKLFEDEIR